MRAAWYEKTGPAGEVLQVGEMPDPEPGTDEVRVRIHASGVNPSDWKTRSGVRPMTFPRVIPHSDGAGIIDRVPRGAQLHALRHTFATRLAEDGANASEIMRLLGHASLATSQAYIEVTAAQQRAAVRANRTNRALGRLAAEVRPG